MNQKMKSYFSFLMVAFVIISLQEANGQVKVDLGKKIEREADKRANKQADKAIDNTFDAAEDAISGSGSDKKEKSDKATPESKTSEKTGTSSKDEANNSSDSQKQASSENGAEPQEPQKPVLTWAKYDFVPGTEIIFEDNQEGEQNGEFPSKWDLSGGTIENANFDGQNVIMFRKCNINGTDGIIPLLKNAKEDYLPEEFTIEFDAYFEKYNNTYRVLLLDAKNQPKLIPENSVSNRHYLRFNQNSADGKDIAKTFYPGFSDADTRSTPGWRHFAISFNKRALKVYIDDARVLNVPNLEYNPSGFTLAFHNTTGTNAGYVKNIRIAKGAVPLYDKFLTDGKFVTTGIKFDVNKSTIKPESMGTINYVVKMMTEHPELNFSVEGHTDSDGEDAANQKLSEARAQSVLNEMTKLGISASRLTSKGHGETKPMAGNDTPEGKAQNRRVEFVKF